MSGTTLRNILNYILLYLAVGAALAWVYLSTVRANPGPVTEVKLDLNTLDFLLGLLLQAIW